MASDIMTTKDRETLQVLTLLVQNLNDCTDQARENGYEVSLRLDKTKAGHLRLRFHLHKRLGG